MGVLGPILSNFKDTISSLPPHLKGEAIAANQVICNAHNCFGRNRSIFLSDTKRSPPINEQDIFHFIAYVPHSDGHVYELDGLQSGPVPIGTYTDNREYSSNISDMKWLFVARSAIQSRIEMYAKTDIKFN